MAPFHFNDTGRADRLSLQKRESPAAKLDPRNEPFFADQWHLENTGQLGGTPGADINVIDAWNHSTGDPAIIIAALDLGFEQDHPDLKEAWYINTGEIPGNKIDDDDNGYKDDVSGLDN